jgi:hypothetical protein
MQRKPRFIVYELTKGFLYHAGDVKASYDRVNEVFGVFTNWDRANRLCVKLQREHPEHFYGIRELLKGSIWLKEA